MLNVTSFLSRALAVLVIIIFSGSCNPDKMDYPEQVPLVTTENKDHGDVEQLTRDTYRIDIKDIFLTVEYHPREFYFDAEAALTFSMYSDQTRPIIHLDPVIWDTSQLRGLELDGQTLDMDLDWAIIDGIDSDQQAIEIRRTLDSGADHTLVVRYSKALSRSYYMLNSQVSDLYGRSNEESFPTINRYGDLARHRIRFRVHGDLAFRCLGSGRITALHEAGVQSWELDTLRDVPSNTVLFVLVPEQDTVEATRTISGVKVRIVTFQGGASVSDAFGILEPWLAELQNQFGPFPMPEGYSVFLMTGGGGMEYYGGTISALSALAHETFHMYFGTSLVLASYRDSWLDEAINEWYELSASGNLSPIADSFTSNMVSGFSPVGIGFDRRAYSEGAQILQHMAGSLGGRQAMVSFLSHLIRNRTFRPFTTPEFLDYLEEFSGLDYRPNFEQWLYSGETVDFTGSNSENGQHRMPADTSPPASIIARYPELNQGGSL